MSLRSNSWNVQTRGELELYDAFNIEKTDRRFAWKSFVRSAWWAYEGGSKSKLGLDRYFAIGTRSVLQGGRCSKMLDQEAVSLQAARALNQCIPTCDTIMCPKTHPGYLRRFLEVQESLRWCFGNPRDHCFWTVITVCSSESGRSVNHLWTIPSLLPLSLAAKYPRTDASEIILKFSWRKEKKRYRVWRRRTLKPPPYLASFQNQTDKFNSGLFISHRNLGSLRESILKKIGKKVRDASQGRASLHLCILIHPIARRRNRNLMSIREDGSPCRAIEQFVCDWWVLSMILRSIFAEFR